MTLNEYIESAEFKIYCDETLYQKACHAAEVIHKEDVSRRQFYAIRRILASGGLDELRHLAEKQSSKSTNDNLKEFWNDITRITKSETEDISLFRTIRNLLNNKGYLQPEDSDHNPTLRKIRGENRQTVNDVLNSIADIYFEHFLCHCFYLEHENEGG